MFVESIFHFRHKWYSSSKIKYYVFTFFYFYYSDKEANICIFIELFRFNFREVQQAGDRVVQQAGEKVVQQAGEKVVQQAGDRVVQQAGEKVVQQVKTTELVSKKYSPSLWCTTYAVYVLCGLHAVLWSHIGIRMRLLGSESHIIPGLLFPFQHL